MRYLHYDVFTSTPFEGNQLAVYPEPPRDIAVERMQRIAAEMNFSETTFVFPPEGTGDVRMRIFTPGNELPLAGHPTIGTTFALAHEGVIAPGRETFVFELGVGPIPVSLEWDENGAVLRLDDAAAAVVRRADRGSRWLRQRDRARTGRPRGPADRGSVVRRRVPVRAGEDAGRGRPRRDRSARAWRAFTSRRSATTWRYSSSPRTAAAPLATRPSTAACWRRSSASAEDPATGGASGPLGCYLLHHRVVGAAEARSMVSLQGVAMKRPSRIHISIDSDGGAITRVRVGGKSVLVAEGVLRV